MVSDHISTPVFRNQGSEFSACSTKSNFERTTWPTVTNMYDVERPGIMHYKFVLKVKNICKILDATIHLTFASTTHQQEKDLKIITNHCLVFMFCQLI